MDRILRSLFVILPLVMFFSGCGGGGSSSSDTPGSNVAASIEYTDINSSTGFSSNYLKQKLFFRPESYERNDYILSYEFTDSNISWDDNLFNNEGSAAYSIVSSNGIDGVLQYNDGSYELHLNVLSVEIDHLKVCYTYTGIDTVIACDVSQALSWYFDRNVAENNYP
ncbi:hypothetical protein A9Q99_26415 [Gammaproteobacteria bacterium 45_16_T64]|nr:hypothetical protein A9Q99_26415 [Gammaproteobacteria bacterium 45_16_T64]